MSAPPILIEDEATWPKAVLDLLRTSQEELRLYVEFEGRRYQGSRTSAEDRQRQSIVNPQHEEREKVLHRIRLLLREHRVLGCHCTRLTPDEMEDVRVHGLRPATLGLYEEKLQRRVEAGDLTPELARDMILRVERRLDPKALTEHTIWGTLGRTALTDEDGLGNPLTYWGGEAVLLLSTLAPHYFIGQGCIVEFHIPAIEEATVCPLQEAFVNQYLFSRDIGSQDGVYDICWAHPIPATDITRIITAGQAEFEELTGASQWRTARPFG